jgi:hypothetical protein
MVKKDEDISGVRVQLRSLLILALDGVSGQLHDQATLSPGKRVPGTHCIGGWLGPRAGLHILEKRKISYHYWD